MNDWQRRAVYVLLTAVFVGLLVFNIGGLTGGYSANELHTAQNAAGWKHILDNPLYAPFLIAVRLLAYGVHDHLLAARLASACIGLLTLIMFYTLIRYWHGERAALCGTLLFGFSAWFLHTTRLGTPDVLLFGVLAMVACYIWLRRTNSGIALFIGFLLAAALLYVPGMVWFIAIGAILQWRAVDRYFKHNLWAVTAGALVLIAALVPLGLAIYHDPQIAKVYAGLQAGSWPDPLQVLKNIAAVPLHLFIQNQASPEYWLGKLAIIDYFTSAMFFLGGYLYIRHAKLQRFWVIVIALIAGIILVGMGGGVGITIIMPFIYILAAAGIGLMFDRWLTVFPRNTIAQSVGYSLVGVAVAASCFYSFKHYFIAWPAARATRAVFTLQDQS